MIVFGVEGVLGVKVAGIEKVHRFAHVAVYIRGLNLAAERICICEQQFASVLIFRLEVIVVKLVHTELRQLENAEADSDRFIEHDFLASGSDHNEVRVNYLCLSV